MDIIYLTDWSLTGNENNLYFPPECRRTYLQGIAINHPKLGNSKVHTSYITYVAGRFVATFSGSVYALLAPNPKYVEYCQKAGRHIPTELEPIKVHNPTP